MKKETKNLPVSIHMRLKNLARERGRPFQELFYYYAIERFLYRLAKSSHRDSFVLKGGLMFAGWGIALRRPTRDIDVQGYVDNSIEGLVMTVREICSLEVAPDGMRFDPVSVRGEQIQEGTNYPGTRIFLTGYLGQASIQLHLDVSFSNVITPESIEVDYPLLLPALPGFRIRGYPYETAIAEKFQAMVALGTITDRLKDYFDIWLLSQQVPVDGAILVEAFQSTFRRRSTSLPLEIPLALTDEFAAQRQPDWERFLNRSRLSSLEYPSFDEVVSQLRLFLWPVVQAAEKNAPFEKHWENGGPWMSKAR